MKYCWDVFNKSECDTCHYFKSYSEGTLDLEKDSTAREVVVVPEDQEPVAPDA